MNHWKRDRSWMHCTHQAYTQATWQANIRQAPVAGPEPRQSRDPATGAPDNYAPIYHATAIAYAQSPSQPAVSTQDAGGPGRHNICMTHCSTHPHYWRNQYTQAFGRSRSSFEYSWAFPCQFTLHTLRSLHAASPAPWRQRCMRHILCLIDSEV